MAAGAEPGAEHDLGKCTTLPDFVDFGDSGASALIDDLP
jgi:hypothetical protein